MARCPYCNRELTKEEKHCWFCEQDVSKVKDKEEKPRPLFKRKKQKLI